MSSSEGGVVFESGLSAISAFRRSSSCPVYRENHPHREQMQPNHRARHSCSAATIFPAGHYLSTPYLSTRAREYRSLEPTSTLCGETVYFLLNSDVTNTPFGGR
ncbi:unnamed protein product [Ectocarpus sp. CCAP 1310/34]|nr:unnamed protein product [Ectocarpus sp. CCAP 1310/34]